MKRRTFISLLVGVGAWPLSARAQQKGLPIIGYLHSASPAPFAGMIDAFREGLRQTGFVEGKNVAIEFRWAEGHYDRLAQLAAELVHQPVDVIATGGGPAPALAAKAATNDIPIVFNLGGNPVKLGLIESFNRPGGNVTGVNFLTSELDGKRLGLLGELVLKTAPIGVLLNPRNPNAGRQLQDLTATAQGLHQPISVLYATNVPELDAAFAKWHSHNLAGLLVGADPIFNNLRDQVVALAARLAVPAIYEGREFAMAGGLMSYGTKLSAAYHQVGIDVGKILKGAKPADLPVIQPTKFELVINLRTAKALGLTVPQLLLAQADKVIE
jgi:putative ABC transport system substrate-binding protein